MKYPTNGETGTYTCELLAAQTRTGLIRLTVTHFVVAVAVIGETDTVASLPRRTVERYADRFRIVGVPPPFDQGAPSEIQLVMPRAALARAAYRTAYSGCHPGEVEGATQPQCSPQTGRPKAFFRIATRADQSGRVVQHRVPRWDRAFGAEVRSIC